MNAPLPSRPVLPYRARFAIRPFPLGLLLAFALNGPEPATAADAAASAPPAAPAVGSEWKDLFDGATLRGWKSTPFGGAGEVEVKEGRVILPMGAMLTGITYTNPVPTVDYEVELEAMKVDGSDFFCGLTVPVRDSHCSLIVGGWGGGIVGISSLGGYDASENDTTKYLGFAKNRWYKIRLRVTAGRIEAWIDADKVVNADIRDRKVSLRAGEIELSAPFGIAAYQTTAAFRTIRLRAVSGPDSAK